MYRLFKTFSLAATLAVVSSDRSAEDEHDSTRSLDKMLKVENAYLKQEVTELRAELRVAASGSFIQKQEASTESEGKPGHKHHKHHPKRHPAGSTPDKDFHPRHIKPGHEFGEDDEEKALVEGKLTDDDSEERSTGDGVGGLLPTDLLDISDAIAKDAATVARTVEKKRKNGGVTEVKNGTYSKVKDEHHKVLFVIYSSSKFYDTRMRWIWDTWAKNLNSSQLVIIGDGKAPALAGAYVHQTRCTPNDPAMETCCKYAEAVIVAQTMMWQNPDLQWAYMADDDSYIRAPALERALLKQEHSRPRDRGIVLGNYGCVTANCSDLLCGSSGYAANRWAIDILAGGDPAGMVQEVMQNCNRCGGDAVYQRGLWGDAGLSEAIKNRGIETRKLEGIYGWMLDKSCLEFSLESENEPLLYHSMRTRPQMELLHRLFASVEEQTGSSIASSTSSAMDGLGGCVEFRGNVQCAASRAEEDRPWHRGPSLCQRPRMPRLPILLGSFLLLLLFVIVTTFIWAGFRLKQHEWDAWKLQNMTGLKWHSYPMQGRSRMR